MNCVRGILVNYPPENKKKLSTSRSQKWRDIKNSQSQEKFTNLYKKSVVWIKIIYIFPHIFDENKTKCCCFLNQKESTLSTLQHIHINKHTFEYQCEIELWISHLYFSLVVLAFFSDTQNQEQNNLKETLKQTYILSKCHL